MKQNLKEMHQDRQSSRWRSLFKKYDKAMSEQIESALCLTCSDDLGVRRNGGRLGTRHGPEAILNILGGFAKRAHYPQLEIEEICPLQNEKAQEDFDQNQKQSIDHLKTLPFKNYEKILMLGGGHDHIYPWLMAIDQQSLPQEEIVIINLDAHLDTRNDIHYHSGTPFRQFDQQSSRPFHLWQVGIHSFANPESNYGDFKRAQMRLFEADNTALKQMQQTLAGMKGPLVVLSLDADALNASFMEGVSAVNPSGMTLDYLKEFLDLFGGAKYFGIYEYNPLYDNLSCKGARSLAYLLEQFLTKKKA